jgi:hypothetical protein
MINHCDRRITIFSDTDISFGLSVKVFRQCSRIPIPRYPWQVNFGMGKVDFQTLVVRGQVDFN